MGDTLGPARKSVIRIWAYVMAPNFLQPYLLGEPRKSVGTGFVIEKTSQRVRILTCAHVIEQAFSVKVEVPALGIDALPARVVAFVPSISFDIAILEFDTPENFEGIPLPIGSSETLRPGQSLYSVGFPLGQDGVKVSNGVYSGYQDLLQHTVSISPGNSGGPLLNEKGEVVGIINSRMVGVEVGNVGYALPIEFYSLVQDRLLKPVSIVVRIPIFGIIVQPTTEHYHRKDKNPSRRGARITYVHPGSHASDVGIQPGMILQRFETYPITSKAEVRVKWNEQPVHLNKVLERAVRSTQNYEMEVWDPSTSKSRVFQVQPRDLEVGSLQFRYPPYEPLEYLYLGGMILMPLYHQHRFLQETASAYMYNHREDRGKPYIVLTKLIEGDFPVTLSETSGLLLEKVNQQPVRTLQDVQKQFCASREFVEFSFHNGETQTLEVHNMRKLDAQAIERLHLNPAMVCQQK